MVTRSLACVLTLVLIQTCFGQQPPLDANLLMRQRAEALLNELPGQIKYMDEPSVRIFLWLQLASLLWSNEGERYTIDPEAVTAEAWADLQERREEVPALYAQTYRSELLALLRLRAPALVERYEPSQPEAERAEAHAGSAETRRRDPLSQLRVALALLETRDGVERAIEMVGRSIRAGQEMGPDMVFFFTRLKELRPAAVSSLLAEILSVEERQPRSISLETFYWLARFYLNADNAPDLTRRFLPVLLNATRGLAASEPGTIMAAHGLLESSLPLFQTLMPALYAEAAAQTVALNQLIPREARESRAARERIRQSADRIEQLLIEARAARVSSTRNMYLAEAAQLALRQGELRRAIDIAADNAPEGNGALWRDQFLDEAVSAAIRSRDIATADYAASKMILTLNRALAQQKIAVYHFGTGDIARAREVMTEAFRLANAAENGAPKAITLLKLAVGFARVDEARMSEVMQAAIRVINNIPTSEERRGSEARNDYIKSTLMPVVWNIFPVFRALARANADETLHLAHSIRRREMRGAAILGAAVTILSQDANAQTTSRLN